MSVHVADGVSRHLCRWKVTSCYRYLRIRLLRNAIQWMFVLPSWVVGAAGVSVHCLCGTRQ